MDNCAICYRTLRSAQSSPSKESLVEQQLSVLFLLDNLLNVTEIKEKYETLLKTEGNPSTWIKFCYPCSIWVESGKKIFRDIVQLQKDLDELKDQVESTIRNSYKKKKEGTGGDLCSILRATVVNGSNNRGTENQVQEGTAMGAVYPFATSSIPSAKVKIEEDEEIVSEEENFMDTSFLDDFMGDDDGIGAGVCEDDNNSNRWIGEQDEDGGHDSFGEGDNSDSDTDYEPVKIRNRRERKSSKTRRPQVSTSIVHQYYEELDTTFRCTLCGKELSKSTPASTSSRLRHLRTAHPKIAQEEQQRNLSASYKQANTSSREEKSVLPSSIDTGTQDVLADENGTMPSISHQRNGPSIVHQHFDDVETAFRCKLCGKELSNGCPGNTFTRLRHLRTIHPDVVNNKQSVSAPNLQRRQLEESSRNSKQFSSGNENSENMIVRHKYDCEICGRPFESRTNRWEHAWTHLNEEEKKEKAKEMGSDRQCPICSKPFLKPALLRMHLASVHRSGVKEKEQYERCKKDCEICGKPFPTKETYNSHIELHLRLVDDHFWEQYCKGEKISMIIQKDENGRILNIEPSTVAEPKISLGDDMMFVTLQKEDASSSS